MRIPSLDVYSWIDIAAGDSRMPESFQRFIAAWELVVAWHRAEHPTETTDAKLKQRLAQYLPELDLAEDDDWMQAVSGLLPWEVVQMAGGNPTAISRRVAGPTDWVGLVDVLYTIRCNLLKGGKSPSDPRDLALTGVAADVTLLIGRALHGV